MTVAQELDQIQRDQQEFAELQRQLEEQAARLAEDPDHVKAAELLGVKPAEVARVTRWKGCPIITTTDAVEYIAVDIERPDAEGKTGVMLRHRPRARTSFPVFAPWGEAAQPPASVPPAEAEAPAVDESRFDDEVARALTVEMADTEQAIAEVEAGRRHEVEGPQWRESLKQIKGLLGGRRARLREEQAALHPEAPSTDEVSFMTLAYQRALAIVAAGPDAVARRRVAIEFMRRDARLADLQTHMAERDLETLPAWFEHRGLALPEPK